MEIYGVPGGDVVGAPLLHIESTAYHADHVPEVLLHVPLQQRHFTNIHVPQKRDLPIALPHLPARRPPPPHFACLASASWAPLEQPAPTLRSLGPGACENPDSWEPQPYKDPPGPSHSDTRKEGRESTCSLINLNLNSHMQLVATILNSADLENYRKHI